MQRIEILAPWENEREPTTITHRTLTPKSTDLSMAIMESTLCGSGRERWIKAFWSLDLKCHTTFGKMVRVFMLNQISHLLLSSMLRSTFPNSKDYFLFNAGVLAVATISEWEFATTRKRRKRGNIIQPQYINSGLCVVNMASHVVTRNIFRTMLSLMAVAS